MTALRLIQLDFDNMENRNSEYSKTLAIFTEEPHLSAYAKLQEWIGKQPAIQLYTGYDHNVYPQFVVKQIEVF